MDFSRRSCTRPRLLFFQFGLDLVEHFLHLLPRCREESVLVHPAETIHKPGVGLVDFGADRRGNSHSSAGIGHRWLEDGW